MTLRAILRAVGASEADMEKGQLRAEANVSVRRVGDERLGVKTELKNINSFRALHRAVAYEIERQIGELEAGRTVVQETRGWSEPDQRTFSQRGKEGAQDYRYFPEPDLPPLTIEPAWVEALRQSLPELPHLRRRRLQEQYSLPEFDAQQLVLEAATADLFEATVAAGAPAKATANWIIGESPRLDAARLAELLLLVDAGTINRDQGIEVLRESERTGEAPRSIVERLGLAQESDAGALSAVVDALVAEDGQAVRDYRAGNQRALGALMAEIKQRTGGRANMKLASSLLRERLGS
ncbi:MAG: Asp-tRNA(Asn)/Glu-tRNA(Gln) amidotransferase GatCAB subunit B, partial [Candidatus Dormibacteraeota bacterium]|nr:Asp-tRNA(Asn)/Glu-tRNA(Gln) amidotransferase GatCAB subunit B [Candidatus Dormibacteraeota bacterium]